MFLLIDTRHNSGFSIAVGDEYIWRRKIVEKEFVQSEQLLKEIDKLLVAERVKKPRAIIIAAGPGDFSALRVGAATANALGLAWRVPVVGVKSQKASFDSQKRLEKVWQTGLKQIRSRNFTKMKYRVVIPFYQKKLNIHC